MSWYTRLVKTAMPQVNVECPHCSAKLEVDARQRTDQRGSSDYQPGMVGLCFTTCPTCKQYLGVDWTWSGYGMIWGQGVAHPASEQEVLDEIRDGRIFVACNVTTDPETWQVGVEQGKIAPAKNEGPVPTYEKPLPPKKI